MISISKKIKIILIFLILIIFILKIYSVAMVSPTSDFYVNDYAGILDESTKNHIMNANIELNQETGAQIVVVTVKNLEGNSLEDYATTLFRKFGIGDKNKNNGVLLLLALEERQFRIEVGYGLEGTLTDAKTGRIQDDYIIPYLKNNDWNNGIKNGFNAVLQEVYKEYNIEGSVSPEVVKINNNILIKEIVTYFSILGSFIMGVMFTKLLKKSYKKKCLIILIMYLLKN